MGGVNSYRRLTVHKGAMQSEEVMAPTLLIDVVMEARQKRAVTAVSRRFPEDGQTSEADLSPHTTQRTIFSSLWKKTEEVLTVPNRQKLGQ